MSDINVDIREAEIDEIVRRVMAIDVQDREILFEKFSELMCPHCYRDVPERGDCYCWRDE